LLYTSKWLPATQAASLVAAAAGKAHWEVLLRARAIECQCYVIAAAQAGVHNEKRESYGHALIIDPWGVVIGRLEDPQTTGEAHVHFY
jgi:predicted amidohydrolase